MCLVVVLAVACERENAREDAQESAREEVRSAPEVASGAGARPPSEGSLEDDVERPPAFAHAPAEGPTDVPTTEAPGTPQCRVPALPIPRPRECERGEDYPTCKWQMPAAPLAEGRYRRWRNTIVEHWWARPSLVSFLLASADEYRRLHPDQVLAIGDLDAPGPRHRTHDRGVDVDLYLLGALMTENAGGGRYPSNYEGKDEAEVEALRGRVLDLAKVLARCSNGAIRIYYNDPPVLERFLAWYGAQGFPPSPFDAPMQAHNSLHDFHFHVTIADELPVLPGDPLPEGLSHPIARIEPPPPPESAPHLSSRNRRPGEWAAVPRE
ncbi:MAG: hypothetical protein KF901_32515 [Myxococcales bacterium]|nr:hypothetical protein [Myxococcales bacterium]